MREVMTAAADDGITVVVFGDLFLEDVRGYRVSRLAPTGIEPVFPIWGSDTASLSIEMITAGLGAFVTAVDTTQLDSSFVGRRFDEQFLADLPEGVDPLGENGEFHTFCFAGPMFDQRISCHPGEIVDRGRFVYADVLWG
jgi:diphthamide synthase (EF-2-diphthine--ammonia ligase)